MAEGFGGILTNVVEKYGKNYLTWLISMLTNPASIVRSSQTAKQTGKEGEYLLTILLISTFLGATVGALIPGRPPIAGRIIVFVVVSLLWLFLSLLVHFFCRLIGGKLPANITISLMIQNLAFAYVVSNFLTLLITWLAKAYGPANSFFSHFYFLESPGTLLFSLQFFLLLFLVPSTVSYAHGFRGVKWISVALFAAIFAILFGFPVYSQNQC